MTENKKHNKEETRETPIKPKFVGAYNYFEDHSCSNCGVEFREMIGKSDKIKFCPNCGCRFDWGDV